MSDSLSLSLARQHILTGLPDESIAAAALTWQQALAISETGKLHECTLPVTQPADNKAHEAEHVLVKWGHLDVAKPVRAVAAGELHRWHPFPISAACMGHCMNVMTH